MNTERRRAPRYRLASRVGFPEGGNGVTRDISTVGIFFETEQGRSIGDAIHLTVDLGESSIECEGRIVRVEDLGRRYGIAVELTSYQFE